MEAAQIFRDLVYTIDWSNQPPLAFIKAIRLALAIEAPLIARRLAEQGAEYYPNHPEISKAARILAAPKITIHTQTNIYEMKPETRAAFLRMIKAVAKNMMEE